MYKQTLPESDNYNYTTGISYQLHGGEWPTPPWSCSGVQQHCPSLSKRGIWRLYRAAMEECGRRAAPLYHILQALANITTIHNSNQAIDRPLLDLPAA